MLGDLGLTKPRTLKFFFLREPFPIWLLLSKFNCIMTSGQELRKFFHNFFFSIWWLMAGDLEQLKKLFAFRIFFGTLPGLNYSCKIYPMVCNLHNICKKLHQFEISILESSYFGLRLSKVYSRFYFYFTIRLLMFILCLHRKSSGIPYKKPPA